MNMAKAYDDYCQSINAGWSKSDALEHACICWNVTKEDLLAYISNFE